MELFDSKEEIVKRFQEDKTDLAIYAPNCDKKELAKMLHAESEKRMRAVQAKSKLKDYINMKGMTYNDTIQRNMS